MRRTLFLLVTVAVFFVLFVDLGAAAGSYVWPVEGKVLVPYKADGHRGLDIACAVGDSVASAQDGNVVWVGKTPRGESCITIEHSDGVSSTYLPVKASVGKGQKVNSGEMIGDVSAEGDPSSEETHVHFGLYDTATRNDKTYLDPVDYLSALSIQLSSDSKKESVEPVADYAVELKPEALTSSKVPALTPEAEPFVPESISAPNSQINVVNPSSSDISYGDLNANDSTQANRNNTSIGVTNTGLEKTSIVETENRAAGNSARQSVLKSGAGSVGNVENIIIDNTYHGASNKSTLNNVTVLERQIKGDKSIYKTDRTLNSRPGDQTLNSRIVSKMYSGGSPVNSSSLSTTYNRKQGVIESINPFVSKTAGQARSSNMIFVSNKAQKTGESQSVYSASSQRQQEATGLVGKVMSWEGLPDAVALLAMVGIAMLSVTKFIRNSRIIGSIMPTSLNVSC